MLTALGAELYTKQVIVVDDDVDIYDMKDVMWAVATRVRAEKDILMVPGVKSAIIDPTSDPATFTVTKMGIDATAPINEDFAQRLIITSEQRSRAREILAGANVI
jgi:2,5-furandicarboxylate decarboxylase 1